LLFKPSMEHLQTYPNVYIDNETYVSFKWDFSDFEEKLDMLLRDQNFCNEVAQMAQEKYQDFISEKGQEAFCKRFVEKISVSEKV